jgi:hypothetical protein
MEKQLEQVGEEMARQRAQMAEAQARMAVRATVSTPAVAPNGDLTGPPLRKPDGVNCGAGRG